MRCANCVHAREDDWREFYCLCIDSQFYNKLVEDDDRCNHWKERQKHMTNIELIKRMEAAELADFLQRVDTDSCKIFCEGEAPCWQTGVACRDRAEAWLSKNIEEDN